MLNWSSEFTHVTAAMRAVADVILILITGSSWVPDQGAVERCSSTVGTVGTVGTVDTESTVGTVQQHRWAG